MAKTKLVRMYIKDYDQIKLKFPDVKMADFIHISTKSNPFIQVESILRGKRVKKQKG